MTLSLVYDDDRRNRRNTRWPDIASISLILARSIKSVGDESPCLIEGINVIPPAKY